LGVRRLISITSVLAIAITVIMMVLTFWVNPMVAAQKSKGLTQDNLLDTLRPGRFQVINGGTRVVYVEQISRDHKRADNLFIAEQRKTPATDATQSWLVVSAEHGFQFMDPITKDNFIVSTNGYRYEGTPGQNEFKVIQFKKYAVLLPVAAAKSSREEEEAIPTNKLWHDTHNNPAAAAELQWRFALPVSVLILALLGIPLSHVRPRTGRYLHLLPAILIYIVYFNLLFITRNWIEQGVPFSGLGMWAVHGIMFLFAVLLLVSQRYYKLRPLLFFKRTRKLA
jgi:lipopolysaccharide export system permease protein